MRPLAGADAQILDLLIRVCRIGEHRHAWDAAAVRRVAEEHLRPRYATDPPPPRPVRRKKRKARAVETEHDTTRGDE